MAVRYAFVGLALILVIVVAVMGRKGTAEAQKDKPPAEKWVAVTRGDLRSTISAVGSLSANLDVEIKCKASGEITELPFDVSAEVKKGTLIARLDPIDEDQRVQQARVSLDSSRARLVQSQITLKTAETALALERRRAEASLEAAKIKQKEAESRAKRQRELAAKQMASQEDMDSVETARAVAENEVAQARIRIDEIGLDVQRLETKRQDVKLAEAQVSSDEIALAQAERRLKETRILAPIDGVVAARPVQIGQIISSGVSNVGGGTTVMTLSDLSKLFVVAAVDEADIGKVKPGQPVIVTADAFPGRNFRGEVVLVATRGTNESGVVTFDVKIEVVGRSSRMLKPEMTANVEIVVDEAEKALLVPAAAVQRQRRKRIVTARKAGGLPETREVTVAFTDGLQSVISEGLAEGEEVRIEAKGGNGKWQGGGGSNERNQRRGMRMMGRVMGGGRGR